MCPDLNNIYLLINHEKTSECIWFFVFKACKAFDSALVLYLQKEEIIVLCIATLGNLMWKRANMK